MTAFTLVTAPAVEPVTLVEMKTHARIDSSAEDDLITALIVAAREWAERYTGRAFINQTWKLSLDKMPEGNFITLSRPPLVSVSSVKVFDDSDASETWAASNYFVDVASEPGRLALRQGASWPDPARATNGVVIEYIAGYGGASSAVPGVIKTAIKQLVTHWIENRGEALMAPSSRGDGTVHQSSLNVPMVIHAILNSYRIQRLGA
ncbi:MAG: head-tail connector protein [Alphaproteobacteria bacterium]|nr:head-tail connector protein [Alphaproteobacteria bacterium]